MSKLVELLKDPIKFTAFYWPEIVIYRKQAEVMESVLHNDETIVHAGNQLGKDFITALISVWFFVSRVYALQSSCRIITSSAGQTQLKSVLWGEIRRLINTARFPLPIELNEMEIYALQEGIREPRSYIKGIVTNVAENMLGHHLERGPNGEPTTMAIFDEASSIQNEYYEATDTWAHRKLAIGNPLPCANFFKAKVKAGTDKYCKVIRIRAEDSPNVIKRKQLIPGLIDHKLYKKRRDTWDKVRQCIGLDGLFYEGAELLLYPPTNLAAAETQADRLLKLGKKDGYRVGEAVGIDPAEGGDSTVWTVIDHKGIILQEEMKTPNTSVITNHTIALMNAYRIDPEKVAFDRGGGGKQHADKLREQGYEVMTVAFGESATDPNHWRRKYTQFLDNEERLDTVESRYVYKNRRAEMYGLLRELLMLDKQGKGCFGIPAKYTELIRQLSPLPLLYDVEGRMYLPPKDKPTPTYKGETIKDMLGCSPDHADSLVLAVFAMLSQPVYQEAG